MQPCGPSSLGASREETWLAVGWEALGGGLDGVYILIIVPVAVVEES